MNDPSVPPFPPPRLPPGHFPPTPQAHRPKATKAVPSMVLGIIGLVSLFCGWVIFGLPSLILGILAIVFGQIAKDEIAANPGLDGYSQAQAGFVTGIIATVLGGITLIIVATVAVYG